MKINEERNEKVNNSTIAKLHEVNKRTLHYYDDIGLFLSSYKRRKRVSIL